MINLRALIHALRAKWVYRVFNDIGQSYTFIPDFYLNQYGNNFEIFRMNLQETKQIPNFKTILKFYQDVLRSWIISGGGQSCKPDGFINIRKQFLWGNKLITYNRKPLFFKTWTKYGIKYVNDLLNYKNVLSEEYVMRKIDEKANLLQEMYMVVNSTPKTGRIF